MEPFHGESFTLLQHSGGDESRTSKTDVAAHVNRGAADKLMLALDKLMLALAEIEAIFHVIFRLSSGHVYGAALGLWLSS